MTEVEVVCHLGVGGDVLLRIYVMCVFVCLRVYFHMHILAELSIKDETFLICFYFHRRIFIVYGFQSTPKDLEEAVIAAVLAHSALNVTPFCDFVFWQTMQYTILTAFQERQCVIIYTQMSF